jgi:hypothetical protein
MKSLKQTENQKSFLIIVLSLVICFAINLFLKWHMFGQYTNTAQESWLSGVSSLFTQNWLNDGILNLKFGMFRTFDSIELRNVYEREVYTSFLPGSLILPYLVAKLFNFKADLVYFEVWSCLFHLLGAFLTACISLNLALKANYSRNKAIVFSVLSGSLYIFSYLTFMQLSFGYYADTAVYVYFLGFLLTEFIDKAKFRLILKSCIILVGVANEWYMLTVAIISLILELRRKENNGSRIFILACHLTPILLDLSFYLYQLISFDKFEHTWLRIIKRSWFLDKESGNTLFNKDISYYLNRFYFLNFFILILFQVLIFVSFLEKKLFRENLYIKNIFLLTVIPSIIHTVIMFQHTAVHYFTCIRFLIPIILFLPILIYLMAEFISKSRAKIIFVVLLVLIFLGNLIMIKEVMKLWKPEHKIYSQLKKAFHKFSYEDIFFSYNLQILMDIYDKDDIKTDSEKVIKAEEREEGEPFTHLLTRKQVYHIENPNDIKKMVFKRELENKARVHLVFFDNICPNVLRQNQEKIYKVDDLFFIDITSDELKSKDFATKYSCFKKLNSRHYFAFSAD